MWKNHREETVPQACLPTVSSYSSLFPALKVLWTFGTAFQPAVDTAWYCSLVAANGSMGDERTQGCSLVASELVFLVQPNASHPHSVNSFATWIPDNSWTLKACKEESNLQEVDLKEAGWVISSIFRRSGLFSPQRGSVGLMCARWAPAWRMRLRQKVWRNTRRCTREPIEHAIWFCGVH